MKHRWIKISCTDLYRLTDTIPRHLRWEWHSHPTHGLCLRTPRRHLWKFHVAGGARIARVEPPPAECPTKP